MARSRKLHWEDAPTGDDALALRDAAIARLRAEAPASPGWPSKPRVVPWFGVVQELVPIFPLLLFINGLIGIPLLILPRLTDEKSGMPIPVAIGVGIVLLGLLIGFNSAALRSSGDTFRKCRAARSGFHTWAVIWYFERVETRERGGGRTGQVSYLAHYAYLDRDGEVAHAVEDTPTFDNHLRDQTFEPVLVDSKPPHPAFLADAMFPGARMLDNGRFRQGLGLANAVFFFLLVLAIAGVAFALHKSGFWNKLMSDRTG